MARTHVVRVGLLGHVGRFQSSEGVIYPRRTRVIVRSARGLEIGEVLTPPSDETDARLTDGSLLRAMTVEDELLETRLQKTKTEAVQACAEKLSVTHPSALLMDAELLFDGKTLFFYFLGTPTSDLEEVVAELSEVYDATARISQFAEMVADGCGPDCGTEAAACATGEGAACATHCAIAGHCATGGNSLLKN